jgi:hypothetical protein
MCSISLYMPSNVRIVMYVPDIEFGELCYEEEDE